MRTDLRGDVVIFLIDDEIADADRHWVRAHHPAPALLHRTDPATGLTQADFAAVQRWLDARG